MEYLAGKANARMPVGSVELVTRAFAEQTGKWTEQPGWLLYALYCNSEVALR